MAVALVGRGAGWQTFLRWARRVPFLLNNRPPPPAACSQPPPAAIVLLFVVIVFATRTVILPMDGRTSLSGEGLLRRDVVRFLRLAESGINYAIQMTCPYRIFVGTLRGVLWPGRRRERTAFMTGRLDPRVGGGASGISRCYPFWPEIWAHLVGGRINTPIVNYIRICF